MNTISFSYGGLSDTLEEQANKQGLTLGKDAVLLEKLKKARLMLFLHSIITESQSKQATQKLHKRVMKSVKAISLEVPHDD